MQNHPKTYDQEKIRWINGPAGYLSTRELPAPDTIRWIARRKAEVVLAVAGGLITEQDACRRYRLSPEELSGWKAAYHREGMDGLKTTKVRRTASRR